MILAQDSVIRGRLITVTGEVGGFSKETALVEHYKMHVRKGEIPEIFCSSLVALRLRAEGKFGVPSGQTTILAKTQPANQKISQLESARDRSR